MMFLQKQEKVVQKHAEPCKVQKKGNYEKKAVQHILILF